MSKIMNMVVGVVAVSALVVGVVAIKQPSVSQVSAVPEQGPKGDKGDMGPRGPQGERGPAGKDAAVRVGSVASPDIMSPYLAWGGVTNYAARVEMTSAVSSTTCSIQSPAATSSLSYASANFKVIASTTVAEIGYDSTSPNATTSLLVSQNLTANALATVAASTTGQIILGPNVYVNFKVGGGSVAGTVAQKFVGSCSAGFRQIAY